MFTQHITAGRIPKEEEISVSMGITKQPCSDWDVNKKSTLPLTKYQSRLDSSSEHGEYTGHLVLLHHWKWADVQTKDNGVCAPIWAFQLPQSARGLLSKFAKKVMHIDWSPLWGTFN